MAIRKYLARDFDFAISTNGGSTWTTISGINNWSFTIDSAQQDASDFGSGAWGSNLYTQRTGTVTLEGFYLVDAANGARDQGQLLCERAATKVGYEAYRDFRIRAVPTVSGVPSTPIGTLTFVGQVALSDLGGGTTDIMPWGVEIVMDGRPTGTGIFDFILT
jgi:hypothetical protein